MARYQLIFGAASMAWFGGAGSTTINEYRYEADREYPVKLGLRDPKNPWGGQSQDAGVAKVGGNPGALWVEFEAGNQSPPPRFYSTWRVDKDGIATLNEILMATGPYGGNR